MLDLHGISQDAFDKVIGYEVTSRQVYERRYQRLTWPKERSGATGAIGYDFGQATKAPVKADWGDLVDARTLKALLSCCGVTGVAARALVEKLHDVVAITWNDALDVFSNRDLLRCTTMCRAHLPGYDGLSPHCKGVLFSLVMNRGPSFDLPAPRYAEIREIKAAIKSGRRDRGRPARDQRRRFFRLPRACRLPPGRRQMRSRRVTCRDHKARGRARREGPQLTFMNAMAERDARRAAQAEDQLRKNQEAIDATPANPAKCFLAIWLAGCATSGEAPAPVVETPVIPAVPVDVLVRAKRPVTPPDRELDAGEVEKLWKTDRAALARVNACLRRLVCQYQDVRAEIGKIETAICEPTPPPRKKLLGHLFHEKKVASQ